MNLTVGKKLGICIGSLCCVLFLSIGISFYNSAVLGTYIRSLTGPDTRELELYGALRSDVFGLRYAQRGVVIFTSAKDPERVKQNQQTFDKTKLDLDATLKELAGLVTTSENKDRLNRIAGAADQYSVLYEALKTQCQRNDIDGALKSAQTAGTYGNQMQNIAGELIAGHQILMQRKQLDSASARHWALAMSIGMLGLGICIMSGASYIVRSLVRELRSLACTLASSAEQGWCGCCSGIDCESFLGRGRFRTGGSS